MKFPSSNHQAFRAIGISKETTQNALKMNSSDMRPPGLDSDQTEVNSSAPTDLVGIPPPLANFKEPNMTLNPLHDLKVLVVDDDDDVRQGLSLCVRSLTNSRVDEARDGAAALEMLASAQYDQLFLDLMMPGVDGFEVLKAIRAGSAIRPLHTVIVSAWADFSIYRVLGPELGADDMVIKPFSRNQVRAILAATSRIKLEGSHVAMLAA